MKLTMWLAALVLATLCGVQIGLAKGKELERRDYLEKVDVAAARLKLAMAEAALLRGYCDEEGRR